jgi:hypothetical protein
VKSRPSVANVHLNYMRSRRLLKNAQPPIIQQWRSARRYDANFPTRHSTLFAAMRVARRYLFDKTRVRVVLDRICSGGGARGLDSLLSLNKG